MLNKKEKELQSIVNLFLLTESHSFSLHKKVKKSLENLINSETEIRQPKTIKGVKILLCAIHTYKV